MHAKAEWILLLGELQEPNVRGVIIVPKHDGSDVTFRDNPANRKVLKFCNEGNKTENNANQMRSWGKRGGFATRNVSSLCNASGS